MESWVTDAGRDPVFMVVAEPSQSLASELKRLLPDLRQIVGEGRQVTVSFDRGGCPRPAHQPGVLEHPQVLLDGLQRYLVRLSQLACRRVPLGEPGHDVAARRIGEGGEDPGQCVRGHRLLVSTLWLKVTVCRDHRFVIPVVENARAWATTLRSAWRAMCRLVDRTRVAIRPLLSCVGVYQVSPSGLCH